MFTRALTTDEQCFPPTFKKCCRAPLSKPRAQPFGCTRECLKCRGTRYGRQRKAKTTAGIWYEPRNSYEAVANWQGAWHSELNAILSRNKTARSDWRLSNNMSTRSIERKCGAAAAPQRWGGSANTCGSQMCSVVSLGALNGNTESAQSGRLFSHNSCSLPIQMCMRYRRSAFWALPSWLNLCCHWIKKAKF